MAYDSNASRLFIRQPCEGAWHFCDRRKRLPADGRAIDGRGRERSPGQSADRLPLAAVVAPQSLGVPPIQPKKMSTAIHPLLAREQLAAAL